MLGNNAFGGDEKITSITCKRYRPASTAADNIFASCVYANATLNVPSGSLSLYYVAPVWMNFDNIIEEGAVQPVRGDLNGDGKVDIADVNEVINLMLGKHQE